MSTDDEAEKAARENAKQFDFTNVYTLDDFKVQLHGIVESVMIDRLRKTFLAGVEWERARLQEAYRPSYVAKGDPGAMELCYVIPVKDLENEGAK